MRVCVQKPKPKPTQTTKQRNKGPKTPPQVVLEVQPDRSAGSEWLPRAEPFCSDLVATPSQVPAINPNQLAIGPGDSSIHHSDEEAQY